MRQLISESEKTRIRKMNSIEEGWFSDVLDTIKKSDTIKDIKKKFKELTGVDFDKKEESGEVTNEYKSYKIILFIKKNFS